MRALAQGLEAPKTTKRKRDGVVYTPDFVTRFIVEETIGKTLAERFAASLVGNGVTVRGDGSYSWSRASELNVWRDYRRALHSLTIVDPACGSGAFLIAAFDYLNAEYRRVGERLAALGDTSEGGDIDREILAGNLHGVDLNPEPIEITKLSLWLKTAKRGKLLQDLNENIKCGNSLIEDPSEDGRAFDWQTEFPNVFANGGFDIVLGNPPYVRMEILKSIKPYLEKHFAVASDRADLYAYFFERGFKLLRSGGRLGYISSSTFLQTGSGEPLRHFLRTRAEIETVVDFGDVQIFEGVTTYPAILTMRRADCDDVSEDGQRGHLRFLHIKNDAPKDIARAFHAGAKTMPRSRLGNRSWQFEDDRLAALRAKIIDGRTTLGEAYGSPLYGIKTGLNEAFIVTRGKRDSLVRIDNSSDELLVPFLRGEDIKRWCVESEDLFLINTPRGKVQIDNYPAIRDHLLPFKAALESRATKQEWFELQQGQANYQQRMAGGKIVYQDICNSNPFALDYKGFFPANTCYFISSDEAWLLAFLNSKLAWFFWVNLTTKARGGYRRLFTEFVEQTPLPNDSRIHRMRLSEQATEASEYARQREERVTSILLRIPDLLPPGVDTRPTKRLREWWLLDFSAFQVEIKKVYKVEIPLRRRGEWQSFFDEESERVRQLNDKVERAERNINKIVYQMFDITRDEVELLDASVLT